MVASRVHLSRQSKPCEVGAGVKQARRALVEDLRVGAQDGERADVVPRRRRPDTQPAHHFHYLEAVCPRPEAVLLEVSHLNVAAAACQDTVNDHQLLFRPVQFVVTRIVSEDETRLFL